MFHLFNRPKLSTREQAFRDGRLIDMQRPPFRQFNEIVNAQFPLAMTKAAFEQFIRLPGEPERNPDVPPNFRWGILFLTLIDSQQKNPTEAAEALVDVNVLMASGFQVSKTLKVVSNGDGETAGLTFMLPHESPLECETRVPGS